jgi:hypothetical protein
MDLKADLYFPTLISIFYTKIRWLNSFIQGMSELQVTPIIWGTDLNPATAIFRHDRLWLQIPHGDAGIDEYLITKVPSKMEGTFDSHGVDSWIRRVDCSIQPAV